MNIFQKIGNWLKQLFAAHPAVNPPTTSTPVTPSLPTQGAAGGIKNLGLYYGWPSLVNGSRGFYQVLKFFNQYDYIVFGDGGEDPKGDSDYTTIKQLSEPQFDYLSALLYGYVPLGNTQSLSIAKLQADVKAWFQTGARGIFVDEFGFDYWPQNKDEMRKRQIAILSAIGDKRAILNAWDPDDLQGLPLTMNDAYLAESFDPTDTVKLAKLWALKGKIQVFGLTANKNVLPPKGLFDAFGYVDNENYSADNNILTYRPIVEG